MSHEESPEGSLTLTEHLRELRTRLIRSVLGIIVAAVLCYNYVDVILVYIRQPIEKYLQGGGLIYTAPSDKFLAYLKVAFFGGVLLATPWWLYQLWRFIAPGLYARERKYSLAFIFSGSILFAGGVVFAYVFALPAAFEFLMTFGGDADKPMITIDHYLSFFTTMLFVFGLTFELPLVIVILGMLGIVSQRFLREKRRYSIVILSIVAAVLSPPDVVSMMTLLVPLYVLFEISIFLVGFFEKKNADPQSEKTRT